MIQTLMDPLHIIAMNAISLLRSFPPHSHFKQPLLAALTPGLSSSTVSSLFDVSPSLARKAKHKRVDELFQPYPHDVKRPRISMDEKHDTQQWIRDMCPVKSGCGTVAHYQYITNQELYHKYTQDYPSFPSHPPSSPNPVSYQTFMLWKEEIRIRKVKNYFGQFDCVICMELHELE